MSAIQLPVEAFPGELFWSVRDSEGVVFVQQQPESVAKQIALALNLHDELVDALTDLMAAAIHCDPHFENRWSEASVKVREVLARAESEKLKAERK